VLNKTVSSVLKVPRQCPLVLLVGVKQMIIINSKFNSLFHVGLHAAPQAFLPMATLKVSP
jgi:hypothetical protein